MLPATPTVVDQQRSVTLPQQLRTCTTVFAGLVSAGALEIDVDALRRGRSATQVRTTLRSSGVEAGATTLAVAAPVAVGPSFWISDRPYSPEQCKSYREPLPTGVEPMEPRPFWSRGAP